MNSFSRRIIGWVLTTFAVGLASPVGAQEAQLLADIERAPRRAFELQPLGDEIVLTINGSARDSSSMLNLDASTGEASTLVGDIQEDRVVVRVSDERLLVREQYPGRLWLTDGTASGTTLLGEFAEPVLAVETSDGAVFWWTTSSIDGDELWVVDDAGVRSLVTLRNRFPPALVVRGDDVFFIPERKCALWMTSGTAESTRELFVPPGGRLEECRLSAFPGGKLLISSVDSDGPAWITDGTEAQTEEVAGFGDSINHVVVGEQLFFQRNNELWVADGSGDGPTALTFVNDLRPRAAIALGERLVFERDTGEVWVTDGTADGTRALVQSGSGPLRFPQIVDDRYLTFVLPPNDVWRTDGTPEGTGVVATLRRDVSPFSDTEDRLYVATADTVFHVAGGTVWSTTIADRATEAVWPGAESPFTRSSSPDAFTRGGDHLYFEVSGPSESTDGRWATDGTPEGTRPAPELHDGYDLTGSAGGVLIALRRADRRYRFWAYEVGDPPMRRQLPDERPPRFGVEEGEKPIWVQGDGFGYAVEFLDTRHGVQVDVSRVDLDGVVPVASFGLSSEPSPWIDENDALVFAGENCVRWVVSSDGSVERIDDADPCLLAPAVPFRDGRIEVDDEGLWFADGSQRTRLYGRPLTPVWWGGVPSVVALGDRAYFTTVDEQDGSASLWVTDGTAGETEVVDETIWPVRDLLVVGDSVVYQKRVDVEPLQLFRVRAGGPPEPLTPAAPGPTRFADNSATGSFDTYAAMGDILVFAGSRADVGTEPFAIRFDAAVEPPDRADAGADGGSDAGSDLADAGSDGEPFDSELSGSGCLCEVAPGRWESSVPWLFVAVMIAAARRRGTGRGRCG